MLPSFSSCGCMFWHFHRRDWKYFWEWSKYLYFSGWSFFTFTEGVKQVPKFGFCFSCICGFLGCLPPSPPQELEPSSVLVQMNVFEALQPQKASNANQMHVNQEDCLEGVRRQKLSRTSCPWRWCRGIRILWLLSQVGGKKIGICSSSSLWEPCMDPVRWVAKHNTRKIPNKVVIPPHLWPRHPDNWEVDPTGPATSGSLKKYKLGMSLPMSFLFKQWTIFCWNVSSKLAFGADIQHPVRILGVP